MYHFTLTNTAAALALLLFSSLTRAQRSDDAKCVYPFFSWHVTAMLTRARKSKFDPALLHHQPSRFVRLRRFQPGLDIHHR
jgi:hypothetical protein